MEYKGIKWAGNIYQKFEAMCLEVEEVMYEDTVKYVESQVQKVGGSVKKFYAEIMQDLLPPSCVDPVKVATTDLPLNPYCHMDFNKKPEPLDRDGQLKKKEIEDIPDFAQEKLRMCVHEDAGHLSPIPTVFVENMQSDGHSTKRKKLGAHRRTIGIKRVPKNNRPAKACSPVISSPGDESNSVCQTRSVPEEAVNKSAAVSANSVEHMSSSPGDENNHVNVRICDSEEAVNKTLTVSATLVEPMSSLQGDEVGPVCDRRCNPIEAVNKSVPVSATSFEPASSSSPGDECSPVHDGRRNPEVAVYKSVSNVGILVEYIAFEDASTEAVRQQQDDSSSTSTTSEKIVSAETLMQNKDDSQCTAPFHDFPAKPIGASMNERNVLEVGSADMIFSMPKEDKFGKDEPSSEKNLDVITSAHSTKSAGVKIIVPHEDKFDVEFIEKDEIAVPGIEAFSPVGTSALDETCILVEADDVYFTPQVREKHKPYKKKIREALVASRLMGKKKKPPNPLAESVHVKSSAHGSFESDWELL